MRWCPARDYLDKRGEHSCAATIQHVPTITEIEHANLASNSASVREHGLEHRRQLAGRAGDDLQIFRVAVCCSSASARRSCASASRGFAGRVAFVGRLPKSADGAQPLSP